MKRSKRLVLNIVTQMEAGGSQAVAISLSQHLRDRGYSCETLFLYCKRPTYLHEPYVHVLHAHKPRHVIDYFLIWYKLIRFLLQRRPAAVVTYTHYANIMGGLTAWLCRVPIRIATHRAPAQAQSALVQYINITLDSIGAYTGNIAVSRAVKESFHSYKPAFATRLCVIPNGVRTPTSSLTKPEARKLCGLPSHAPVIGTIGRLASVKNHKVLLHALQSMPGWHLVIAGGGELHADLVALSHKLGVAGRVRLLGEIGPEMVGDVLRAMDIFVFPSLHEAFGLAPVEAAGMRIPLVCSDIPAMRELFGDRGSGAAAIFVDPDKPSAISAGIELLSENDELRSKVVQNALSVAENYSLERMVDAYERVINRGTYEGYTGSAV